MNKKKIIGIVAIAAVLLSLVGVGLWKFLGRSTVPTGGNRLGVEWYDENGKEFTITTADQLYEFAELSNYYDFKNQTIKLGADIVVNEGNAADWAEKAPMRKWAPITGFGGVFDGQGHTISGLYAKGRDAAIALFINTMSGAKIQNFKLTNTYFEASGFGGVASISSNGGGKFKQIYSDATITVVGSYSGFAGGICSKLNLQSTLEECWFDGVINTTGRDAAGIVDNVLGCRVTVSHCLFSGEINSTWDFSGTRTAGLVGRIYKTGAGLVLNDSLSVGKINAVNVYYTASVIGASMGSTSLTTTNTYGSLGSYDVAIGRSGANGEINSSPLELREKDLIGVKAYQWTNLDFDKYWAIVEDDTPILKCFAETTPSVAGLEKAFDTSWYMEGASEYIIEDLKDLYGLYYLGAANTFSGKTIKIAADIAINEGKASDWEKNAPENVWYPVSKFGGTLDGQGHTISGMYINSSGEYVGLFKQTTMEATVKNLSVKNGFIHNSSTANVFMGTISGRGGGTFDSIYADTIIVSYGSIVGGIFGQVNAEAKNSFTNCWFDGSIEMKGETARYVGGIAAGVVKGNATFAHCLNTAPISQLDFKDAGMFVGGIAGYIINNGVIASITDCMNTGKISVNYHVCVGSIVGRINRAVTTISDTYATTESYTYSDGTFRGIGTSSNSYTGGVANLPEALLSGVGGYQWTTLNFKDYWSIVTGPDGTPILKSFANKVPSVVGIEKRIDISWNNADKKEFALKDLDDLYGFYIISGFDTFFEDTVKLAADITINEGNAADWATTAPANPWFPINSFKGQFDGQGHTISGVYLKTDKTYSGLFSKTTKESTVKNLKLTNSYFENTIVDDMAAFGSIAGQMGGVLDTVYSDAIVVGYGKQIGGLVGRINHGALNKYKMTNCWFDGSVKVHNNVATMAYVGGLAGGLIQGYLDMDNCLNSGTVTYTFDELPLNNGETHYIGTHVGGLMGGVMNGTQYNKDKTLKRVSEWNVSDTLNSGLVSAGMADGSKMGNGKTFANGAGSVLGYTTSGTVNMKNVYATTESCTTRTMSNGKKAVVSGGVMKVKEDIIVGIGGYQFTDLDFTKYWAAIVNPDGTPVLKSFANAANVANLDSVKKLADFSWYDKNATSYTLDTMEKIYGFAVISGSDNFKDKTIKLGANIDVNPGWTAGSSAPANEWIPISSFAGTFDGNGKTISGIYVNTSTTNAGMFAVTANTSTVKNLKLVNSYFYSDADNARLGSVVGNLGGTLDTVYSSAIVEGTMDQIGGLVGVSNDLTNKSEGIMTITNCWFDGTVKVANKEAQLAYVGGVVGGVIQGTLNMDNCLNTGEISYTYDKMPKGTVRTGVATGGLVGGVMNGVRKDTGKGTPSTLNISDSLNAGSVHAQTSAGEEHPHNDGVRSVLGYTTAGTVTIKGNVYATSESAPGTIHYNNDRARVTGSVNTLAEATLLGTKGYTFTTLNFNKYWSARSADVPALKSFVGAGTSLTNAWRPDTNWTGSGTKTNPYVISTIAELYGFAKEVNGGNNFAGKYLELGASIDVNKGWTASATIPDYVWNPIGNTLANAFQGTFDGKGYEIKGIYVNTSSAGAGLFGHTRNSVIKNFSLKNSYINSTAPSNGAYVGSIIGYGEGKIENIYSNATIVSAGSQVAGIVGRVQEGNKAEEGPDTLCEITNCWYDGSITVNNADSKYVGGLAGFVIYGELVLDNCLFTGDITATFNGAANVTQHNYVVGGFVGQDNAASSVEIKNSLNAGSITTNSNTGTEIKALRAGSVMGYVRKGLTLENVYVTSECYDKTIESSHDKAKQTGAPIAMWESSFLGTKGYTYTKLDFDSYWSARNGEVPALTTFVGNGMDISTVWRLDTDWAGSGTAGNPYVISTIGELYGLASEVNGGNTFAGKFVELGATIDLNKGWTAGKTAPENIWTPIGTSLANAFQGTFDGKGYEIKGVYVDSNTTGAGLFGYTRNSTIKNFSLKNSYFHSSATQASMGSIIGYGEGKLENIYSNAIIESAGTQVAGFVGRVQEGNTKPEGPNTLCEITNCWYDGTITVESAASMYTGGFTGFVIYGEVRLDNCLFTGDITATFNGPENTTKLNYAVGGLVAQDNTESSVKITNSLNAGTITVGSSTASNVQALRIGSVMGYVRNSLTLENVYVTSECYNTPVESAHDNAVQTGAATTLSTDNLLGVKGYQNTMLDFDTSWSARKDKVPALTTFVGKGLDLTGVVKIDTSWVQDAAGTAVDPYLIEDIKDLYGVAALVNGGETFDGKTIKLVKDIDLNEGWTANATAPENVWEPIGSCTNVTNKTGNYFAGTFDGNDKTISGLYVNATVGTAGLFGFTVDSTIRDLRIENSYMASSFANGVLGSFVGYGEGNLINLYSEATLVSDKIQVGGLIGRIQDKTGSGAATANITDCNIVNCQFSGVITSTNTANATVGGLVGAAIYGQTNIQNCIFDGQITAASAAKRVGGLIGQDNATSTTVTIENCVVAGSVSGAASMGTVIGRVGKQSTIKASVYASNTYTIGIYGELNSTDGSLIEAVKVDFANGAALASTVNALNVNVKANNDSNTAHVTWKTWNKENGLPVFGEAPEGEFIDVTPDTDWEGEGTAEKPYLIQTPGELYGLAQSVNGGNKYTGKYFKVTTDIKVNDGSSATWSSSAPDNIWTPIGYCDNITNKTGKPFEGNFDGNYKTISGLYVNETAKSVGLFGYAVDGVIENVILENSYMTSTFDCLAGLVGYGDGTFKNIRIQSNVILEASGIQKGGIIGRVQDGTASKANSYAESNCYITNCWVSAQINSTNAQKAALGGFVGSAIYGTTTIDNCMFDGQISAASTAERVGGLMGNDNGTTTTVTITNTVVAGSISGATKKGAIIGRTGKQTTVDSSVYVSNTYTIGMYGEVNSTDGSLIKSVKKDFTAEGVLADTLLVLNTKANANDGWGNWVPRDGKPVLEQFASKLTTIDVTPDTSWLNEGAGTEADPYILIDAADLYGLASISTTKTYNAFAEKHFKLGANIQLNNGNAADWATTAPANTWTKAIGNNSYKFNGVFDGNNMTISGFYNKSATAYMGLFGYTQTTSVTKNLRIVNSYFEYTGTSNAILGAVAGQGAGEFDNLYSDAILVSTHNYVGGIVGDVNKSAGDTHTIKNCWFNGSIQMKGDAIYVGGITGVAMQGTVNISNCLNTGSISSERTGGVNVGGIVGCAHNNVKLNITNCVNAGPFTVLNDVCVGAIVSRTGVSSSKKSTVVVKNSYMTGDSYTKYDVGTNGTGQYGTGHETSTYVADAATLVTKLNSDGIIWVAKTVNGKIIPVLFSLQDVITE